MARPLRSRTRPEANALPALRAARCGTVDGGRCPGTFRSTRDRGHRRDRSPPTGRRDPPRAADCLSPSDVNELAFWFMNRCARDQDISPSTYADDEKIQVAIVVGIAPGGADRVQVVAARPHPRRLAEFAVSEVPIQQRRAIGRDEEVEPPVVVVVAHACSRRRLRRASARAGACRAAAPCRRISRRRCGRACPCPPAGWPGRRPGHRPGPCRTSMSRRSGADRQGRAPR